MAIDAPAPGSTRAGISWRSFSVRFAVALAFADASIVVLALPQIIDQFDTTISHSTWVIMAYNLALIAGVGVFLPAGRQVNSRTALLAGIGLFGAASIVCAVAPSLELLVLARCAQGFGGALLLCASLPLLAGARRSGESATAGWAAAAAIGAAVGPAAGGLLTQVFDWRAIFVAQAPAAALAIAAVLAVPAGAFATLTDEEASEEPGEIRPAAANLALLLLSSGLIGALFLVVVLMIEIWLMQPATAALVVTAIPIATIAVERLGRGRSAVLTACAGAVALAVGLLGIASVDHKQLVPVTISLACCGAGIGFAFTTLTAAAMSGGGPATRRAGGTVAARDAGLVVGLLVLTPIFVHDLDRAPRQAVPKVTIALLSSPLPQGTKTVLALRLLMIYKTAPKGHLPNLVPAFDAMRKGSPPDIDRQITAVQKKIHDVVEVSVTHSFKRSLRVSALLAALVLPVLLIALLLGRARPSPGTLTGRRSGRRRGCG